MGDTEGGHLSRNRVSAVHSMDINKQKRADMEPHLVIGLILNYKYINVELLIFCF